MLLAMGSPGGGKRKAVPALGENRTVGHGGQQPPTIHNPWTPSQVEQRLEPAKRAAHNVHKRLQACLQGQSGADMDKRVVSGGPREEGPGQDTSVQWGSGVGAGVSPLV